MVPSLRPIEAAVRQTTGAGFEIGDVQANRGKPPPPILRHDQLGRVVLSNQDISLVLEGYRDRHTEPPRGTIASPNRVMTMEPVRDGSRFNC